MRSHTQRFNLLDSTPAKKSGLDVALRCKTKQEERCQIERRVCPPKKPQKVCLKSRPSLGQQRGQGARVPCGVWGSAPQKESYKENKKQKRRKKSDEKKR
jgi:hypothetical protein